MTPWPLWEVSIEESVNPKDAPLVIIYTVDYFIHEADRNWIGIYYNVSDKEWTSHFRYSPKGSHPLEEIPIPMNWIFT